MQKKKSKLLGSIDVKNYVITIFLVVILIALMDINDISIIRGFSIQRLFIIIIILIVSFELSIMIHELGHLVFGLLTGYSFLSIRYRSILLKKNEEGKLSFYKYSLAGTGGQCLLLPPKDKKPGLLYNAGGVLFNLFIVLTMYLVLLFAPINSGYLAYFIAILTFINIMFAYLNWGSLDNVFNDGYYHRLMKNNPKSRDAQLQVLEYNARLSNGELLTEIDMDEESYKEYDPEDLSQKNLINYYIARAMYDLDFEKALEIIEYAEQVDRSKSILDYMISVSHLIVLYYIDKDRAKDYYETNKDYIEMAKKLLKNNDTILLLKLIEEYSNNNTINQEILSKYYEMVEKSAIPGDSKASLNLIDEILRRYELTKEATI